MKEEFKKESFSNQHSFDIKGHKNILMNDEYNVKLDPRKIQVLQFKETELQRMEREEEWKQKIEKEDIQLKEITENMRNSKPTGFMKLQKWSETTFDEVIFDSECCDWKLLTSTFDSRMYGKAQFMIIMKDDNDNIFGYFINNEIHEYNDDGIFDPNAFIFTYLSNEDENEKKMTKFDIFS